MTTTTALRPPSRATGRGRWHEQVLARLRSGSLDAELATGVPAAGRRLRAVRARQLVDGRATLARAWAGVLEAASGGPAPRARVPLRRGAVLADAPLVEAVVDALGRPGTPVQALALAQLLLTDGTGPLYRRGHLDTALLEILLAGSPG